MLPSKRFKIMYLRASEKDLAYLAGIIDGEAWIGIRKNTRKRKRGISVRYVPSILIGTTSKRLRDYLLKFEAFRLLYTRTNPIPIKGRNFERTHQTMYYIGRQSYGIVGILKPLIPYLIIKKPQAIVVCEFCSECLGRVMKGDPLREYTVYEKELVNLVHLLNSLPENLKRIFEEDILKKWNSSPRANKGEGLEL